MRTVSVGGRNAVVLLEAAQVRLNGADGLAAQVRHTVDARIELLDREEGGQVGRVRVGQDHDEEAIRHGDQARRKRVHLEDIDRERVRDGVPERLLEANQDARPTVPVRVHTPAHRTLAYTPRRRRTVDQSLSVHIIPHQRTKKKVSVKAHRPEKTDSKKKTKKGVTRMVTSSAIQT